MGIFILSKLVVLLLFLAHSKAEIRRVSIRQDKRSKIMFDSFKFTHRGNVYISISSVSFTSDIKHQRRRRPDPVPVPVPALLGFYMIPRESRKSLYNHNSCILDSDLLFNLSHGTQFSFHFPVTYPDDYTVCFANCNPNPIVTMTVYIELYNTVDATGAKDFLSLGLKPHHYTIFLVIYVVFLVIWVIICFKNQNQPYFYTIHILMGCLLALVVLNMIFALNERSSVKTTGTPQGWDIYYEISCFFRDQVLFALMVLSGLGWSFLRSPQGLEKIFLVLVLIVRCVVNLASMEISRSGPFDSNWDTWKGVYSWTHIICWVASYVTPALTINWIRDTADKAPGKAYLLEKILPFTSYILFFFGYFCSKLVVLIFKNRLGDVCKWVTEPAFSSVDEVVTLVLYLSMFYRLRPVGNNIIFGKDKKS